MGSGSQASAELAVFHQAAALSGKRICIVGDQHLILVFNFESFDTDGGSDHRHSK